jgi:Fe2+ transport system protein FeoA
MCKNTNLKIISCKNIRLQELGFTPGTIVKEIPSGFGKVFEIRGAKIAIRSSDLSAIVFEKVAESP